MLYPNLFAGVVISSGASFLQAYQMQPLLGNSIRNYYGTIDEIGLANATLTTQAAYDQALASALRKNSSAVDQTRTLETIEIEGADHLDMNVRPWDEDIFTDLYPGVLSWLQTLSRPDGKPMHLQIASLLRCWLQLYCLHTMHRCAPPAYRLPQTLPSNRIAASKP